MLVILLYSGFSLPRSAIYCTLLAIFIGALSKETRIGPKKLLNCLIEGVKQASYVALPTSAAYLIGNVLFCSSIQGLGIEALPANMFIFYFGVIAQITPPSAWPLTRRRVSPEPAPGGPAGRRSRSR